MKKIILVLATCLIFALHLNAQWYSNYFGKTDFMDHTMEEISLLLKYTKGQKTFGYVMIAGGIVATSAGCAIFISTMPILPWDESEPSGGGLFLVGGITLLCGLIVTFTAIDRMKEINKALSLYQYNNISLKISPTFQSNPYSKCYYSGIAIQLTF